MYSIIEFLTLVSEVFILLLLVYVVIWIWILPMNRVRLLCDNVGFAHLSGTAKKREIINRLRKTRFQGKIPPAFPNGWYALAESRELSKGGVLRVTALGQNFAVFRGLESGKAYVTDAYCPHLGADVTAGGRVVGDCIECPFHQWRFEGETGKCVEGPSSEKTRSLANLQQKPCCETSGVILVWFHAESSPPSWHPVTLKEIDDGLWSYQGRNEYHINCHIQDISENGADVAHLDAVHSVPIFFGGQPSASWSTWFKGLAWHEWGLEWKALPDPQGYMAELKLRHNLKFGRISLFDLKLKAYQIGPSLVHMHFDSPSMGRGIMVQYVLPLEPMVQKVVHIFFTERSWWSAYAKIVLWGESVLLERDIMVWNSKRYADKPLSGQEDVLISRHRRWFSQFYCAKGQGGSSLASTDTGLDW